MSQNINSIGLEHLMKAASALTELTNNDSKLIIGKQEERVPISDDDTASATTASLAPSSSTILTSNSANTSSTNNSGSCNSSTTTPGGGSARPASASLPNSRDIFPQRLMRILSDKDVHHIITWLPHGRAFVIVEPEELAEKVLPKHFPESCTSGNQKCKYPSFTRKLNRWGFRQVTRGPDAGAFHHGLFLRDAPQLCLQMICQRTRRRNDKSHDVYHDQQQQQQQHQQQQYGNQTILRDNYAPSVHNPTLLNNHVNSNTTTMITNTTSNNNSSSSINSSNSSSSNNHNNQFFPMNHGGPMSFPHLQAYAHHPFYGALPNMTAATAGTAVNTTSSSGPNIHGNHANPTGMNPPPLGLSATSIHPTQNNKQQHLAHLATASTMPSLMHITPPSSSSSSSSSTNINLNVSNLMNAATFASANNPSPFATAMMMTNNNVNSNVMTNSHSNNGSATGITTPTPPTSQILNQNLPQNFYGNHTISNCPPNIQNTLQGVVNTNPPTATMTMGSKTLSNAEPNHNPAPVTLATSTATTDADASALNTVSDANATSMSNSATSTTTTSTANDNPDKEKKSDSNEKRIATAKNMLYDAYLKALG